MLKRVVVFRDVRTGLTTQTVRTGILLFVRVVVESYGIVRLALRNRDVDSVRVVVNVNRVTKRDQHSIIHARRVGFMPKIHHQISALPLRSGLGVGEGARRCPRKYVQRSNTVKEN